MAPEYVSELLVPLTGQPLRYSLCSASSNQLPVVKLSTYGAPAPDVWNSLPEYLKRLIRIILRNFC